MAHDIVPHCQNHIVIFSNKKGKTILELLRLGNRNHHAKFEINRTILTELNRAYPNHRKAWPKT